MNNTENNNMTNSHKAPALLCLTLLLFASAPAMAQKATDELPKGCHNEGYTFNNFALTLMPSKVGNNDSVYFIYNNSSATISLYQLKSAKENMGININNKIRPYDWGVYSSDEPLVRFACTIPSAEYEHGKLINCKGHLEVCEYTNAKYGVNNRGNYWMTRSSSRNDALRRVNQLGILLRND